MIVEPLHIGPTRDLKCLADALDRLKSDRVLDPLTLQFDDGDYHRTDGEDTINHPHGGNLFINGNPNDPNAVRFFYRQGSYRSTGIYVPNNHALGGINNLSLISDGWADPPDMHAMGLMVYYDGAVHCGPELKENYGSQTRLIIDGFTVGVCASKNTALQADGVVIRNCKIAALAGHGAIVHLGNARMENIDPDWLHFQSYGNGASIYCDGLHIADSYVNAWAAYGAGIAGGGVTGPDPSLWDVEVDEDSFIRINGQRL